MAENKKYVELVWHQKYDKIEKGEKIPIEKPNLPFQVVETMNKPMIKGGYDASLFPEDQHLENCPNDWKNRLQQTPLGRQQTGDLLTHQAGLGWKSQSDLHRPAVLHWCGFFDKNKGWG